MDDPAPSVGEPQEILRCPFCDDANPELYGPRGPENSWHLACTLGVCPASPHAIEQSREAVIAAWNTRAPTSAALHYEEDLRDAIREYGRDQYLLAVPMTPQVEAEAAKVVEVAWSKIMTILAARAPQGGDAALREARESCLSDAIKIITHLRDKVGEDIPFDGVLSATSVLIRLDHWHTAITARPEGAAQ